MERFHFITVLFTLAVCANSQLVNFTNPILDTQVTHPSIFKLNDWYYLTIAANQNTEIHVLKSRFLTNFRYVEKKIIYKVNVGYSEIESPRMQQIDGQLYMYFAMRNESVSQRMYVMKALDSQNPLGGWRAPIRLLENIWSLTSIQGTVMTHNNSLYFVWTSLHPVADTRQLYIAAMNSTTEVVEPIVSLRQPTESWECQGYCSNDYPSFIYNVGTTYMVFSASSYSHPDHCLSHMKIETGRDPMDPLNWQASTVPVFTGSDEEGVYATGHSSFTTSPDDLETWLVYHGSESSTEISGNRLPRIEKIKWDFASEDPMFPTPHGVNSPQPRPSGEPEMFTNPILDDNDANPTVLRYGDYYYLVVSTNDGLDLTILKSSTLTNFRGAEEKIIYSAPEGYQSVWRPKLYELEGQLYVYFGMNNGVHPQSPFVISVLNPSDPMGTWSSAKRLLENIWEGSFIHASVLTLNDRLYFVWSNSVPEGNSSISVINMAQMENPGEIAPPVVLLRRPSEPWECPTNCIAAAPTFLYNNGAAYMMFAAGGGLDPGYSLAYMTIETGRDPMDISNWISGPGPVVRNNAGEDVYAPHNAWFTTSPDGTENWFIYVASDNATHAAWTYRLGKVEWDSLDGSPIFPKPHGLNHPQPVPSSSASPSV